MLRAGSGSFGRWRREAAEDLPGFSYSDLGGTRAETWQVLMELVKGVKGLGKLIFVLYGLWMFEARRLKLQQL